MCIKDGSSSWMLAALEREVEEEDWRVADVILVGEVERGGGGMELMMGVC
jgi:hypothetical protein